MCSGSDVAMVFNPGMWFAGKSTQAAAQAGAEAVLPKPPEMPQPVITNPVADQAKLESDAAQAAQGKTLEQRRRLRANSLLSRTAAGDLTPAELSTPVATGKVSLGS